MESNINNTQELFTITDTMESANCTFQIAEYTHLEGARHITLKQTRIAIENTSVILEAGALYFMSGDISIEIPKGTAKGIFSSKSLTGETLIKPVYTGTGEIYLEPRFGHYILIKLNNEEVIVDHGMFHACESTVKVEAERQKGMLTAVAGGEGFYQTKLSGSGICVLTCKVPHREILKYKLNNETLKVDGTFGLLRTKGVEFSLEKSSKGLLSSAATGEGMLQVYRGTGEVWLAPTEFLYNNLNNAINNIMI